MSDPEVRDSDRLGEDLLARIAELKDDSPGDGWRRLLAAAGAEIVRQKESRRFLAGQIRCRLLGRKHPSTPPDSENTMQLAKDVAWVVWQLEEAERKIEEYRAGIMRPKPDPFTC